MPADDTDKPKFDPRNRTLRRVPAHLIERVEQIEATGIPKGAGKGVMLGYIRDNWARIVEAGVTALESER